MITIHRPVCASAWDKLEAWWIENSSQSWAQKVVSLSRWFNHIHNNMWTTIIINPSTFTSERLILICATLTNILGEMKMDELPQFARYKVLKDSIQGVTRFRDLRPKLLNIAPNCVNPYDINFERSQIRCFDNNHINLCDLDCLATFRPEVKNLGKDFQILLENGQESEKQPIQQLDEMLYQPAELIHISSSTPKEAEGERTPRESVIVETKLSRNASVTNEARLKYLRAKASKNTKSKK